MRGQLPIHFCFRSVFSLILLTANVAAPFRTAALGRVLLTEHSPIVATRPVVRVRVVTPSGSSQGFRSVVGLAKGGPDESGPKANALAFSSFLPVSPEMSRPRPADLPDARPNPPLRC
jgi:hypothetical protein